MRKRARITKRASERGVSLVLVSFALVMILGALALAIDLGMLYVARNEAQRAADAAALAGAYQFLTVGCTSASGGCLAGGAQETAASAQAIATAAQNYVAGKPASITNSNITFSYPTPEEPQITVTVPATVPTFFARVFGVNSGTVDATATAEAYNPSGGSTNITEGCVVPFLVPNCDPDHTSPANGACDSGAAAGYFFNPSTGAIEHPGSYPSGVIGETWQLHTESGPSQWFLIAFTGQSGSDLRTYIEDCSPYPISCGDSLQTMNGKKVGPTVQGAEARINANGEGLGEGQDIISATGPPFAITGGSNNPNPALVGKTFYGPSQSIVVAPVYSGDDTLPPGGTSVSVVGFLQLFITDVEHTGKDVPVNAVIMGVSGCSSSSGGSSPPVVATGGTSIPIRLIHQ